MPVGQKIVTYTNYPSHQDFLGSNTLSFSARTKIIMLLMILQEFSFVPEPYPIKVTPTTDFISEWLRTY